jgi:glucosamine--fructose-6-phosphate aminotransferase (isomerizing)
VASTKAFTTQILSLHLLALALGQARGTLDASTLRSEVHALARLPKLVEAILEDEAEIEAIAREYHDASNFLFLGRGHCYPIALEGALKLKEISYIHAEGYAAGEMKHGPIALIDENMPVVCIATQGAGYDKLMANIEEVRARNGRIIALASDGDNQIAKIANNVIYLPSSPPRLEPVLATIPLQLLAYHVADFRGTDVDQPRNLAKSVTVE